MKGEFMFDTAVLYQNESLVCINHEHHPLNVTDLNEL